VVTVVTWFAQKPLQKRAVQRYLLVLLCWFNNDEREYAHAIRAFKYQNKDYFKASFKKRLQSEWINKELS
jgi:negative regulator of replication initiation